MARIPLRHCLCPGNAKGIARNHTQVGPLHREIAMNTYSLKTGTMQRLFYKFEPLRDLSTISTVKASMRTKNGSTVFANRTATVANGTYLIDGVSTVLTPASGVVFVDVTATDTATKGFYEAEFPVVYTDGKDDVIPSSGYAMIEIGERI